MYIELTPELEVVGTESRIESVHIAANLRNEQLEKHFNDEIWPLERMVTIRSKPNCGCCLILPASWKSAGVRQTRPPATGWVMRLPWTNDRITISKRKRGAPIDKLVSELMIFINCRWGVAGRAQCAGYLSCPVDGAACA